MEESGDSGLLLFLKGPFPKNFMIPMKFLYTFQAAQHLQFQSFVTVIFQTISWKTEF